MGIFVEFEAINQETVPSIFAGDGVDFVGAAVLLNKDNVAVDLGVGLAGAAHDTSTGMMSKNRFILCISIIS